MSAAMPRRGMAWSDCTKSKAPACGLAMHALGLGQAGRHGVDRDAVLAELGGERPGEPEHAALGRHVVGEVGRARDHHVGRDVHDAAVAVLAHLVRRRAAGQEHAVEVDGHDPAPLREVDVVPRGEGHDGRVVDQHVQLAVRSTPRPPPSPATAAGSETSTVTGRWPRACAAADGLGARPVDVRDDHRGALLGELVGDGPADALGAAGDDRHAILELHAVVLLPAQAP